MRVFALFSLFLFAACQAPAAEMTDAEIAQIEAEVMAWAEAWMDGWENDGEAGCEANAPLTHPEQVVHLTGGEPQGRAGWLEYCKTANANIAGYSGSWTDMDVRVLSPDAAVFVGRWSGTFEYVSGRAFHYAAGAQLILVERTADGWGLTLFENSGGPAEEVTEEG
jgi:hypothetical protein